MRQAVCMQLRSGVDGGGGREFKCRQAERRGSKQASNRDNTKGMVGGKEECEDEEKKDV